MSNAEEKLYSMSKKAVKLILLYYTTLIIIGSITLIIELFHVEELKSQDILRHSVYASLASGTMLCCVCYIRKIYKALINSQVQGPQGMQLESMGIILYFVFRPIFTIVFIILTVFAMLAGMVIITSSVDYILNNRFVYVCVVVAGIIGFSIGDVIDQFQRFSEKKVTKTFEKE